MPVSGLPALFSGQIRARIGEKWPSLLDAYKKKASPMPRRTLRSTRGGRPYVEAFLALGVLAVDGRSKRAGGFASGPMRAGLSSVISM